jgi:hypothetical protein
MRAFDSGSERAQRKESNWAKSITEDQGEDDSVGFVVGLLRRGIEADNESTKDNKAPSYSAHCSSLPQFLIA